MIHDASERHNGKNETKNQNKREFHRQKGETIQYQYQKHEKDRYREEGESERDCAEEDPF